MRVCYCSLYSSCVLCGSFLLFFSIYCFLLIKKKIKNPMQREIKNLNPKEKIKIKEYGLYNDWKKFVKIELQNLNKMEPKKVEILMEEILRAIKRMDNRLEKIEEKINKIENRIINIEIQQNTLISIGNDPKYIKGTTGKMVEQIIFRKYPERTI